MARHLKDVGLPTRINDIPGGRADADELMAWYRAETTHPRETWVTHGEPRAAGPLAERLRDAGAGTVTQPEIGDVFDLA